MRIIIWQWLACGKIHVQRVKGSTSWPAPQEEARLVFADQIFMSSPMRIPRLLSAAFDKRVVTATEMLNHSAVSGNVDFMQIARAVNLSASRLRHLFTIKAGISPLHYVKVVRLQHARRLMLQSFLTVKEVMGKSGFTDISHFVRDYKRFFGETPSETRQVRPSHTGQ